MRTGAVRISCLPQVAAVALDWQPSHVVSLIDPDLAAASRPSFASPIVHDVFTFFDQENPDHRPAFVALCETLIDRLAGQGTEARAFARLLELTIKPWPNRLLVEIADRRLGRDGALLDPLDAYRARYPRRIDAYHRLNPRRGLISTIRR